jgi:phosphoribosylanthranilate isomerase
VPHGIKVVLLLVNEQPQPTAQAIQAVRPDVVQFHGSETPEWLALLRQNTPLEIWKAIGVSGPTILERAQRFKGARTGCCTTRRRRSCPAAPGSRSTGRC